MYNKSDRPYEHVPREDGSLHLQDFSHYLLYKLHLILSILFEHFLVIGEATKVSFIISRSKFQGTVDDVPRKG